MKNVSREDTKIIKINSVNEDEKIRRASSYILDNKIVVIPTDTLYGLATNPFNITAVKKIFEIKRRPLNKPIPLLVSDINQIDKYVKINRLASKLIDCFWPGMLTIIFNINKDSLIPPIVTSKTNRLALRMPSNKITLKIIEYANGIITGTSANISGRKPPSSISELDNEIAEKVDLIIDSGKVLGKASTIIDVTHDKPIIIRIGAIPVKEIQLCIGNTKLRYLEI
ncbi:MAG: threonylcarbamoyl-AMP synthase [Thermoproteales archaeon]|nr:threonylcarbamoyl-AMP synthase [Thermoproteales archaeon]